MALKYEYNYESVDVFDEEAGEFGSCAGIVEETYPDV